MKANVIYQFCFSFIPQPPILLPLPRYILHNYIEILHNSFLRGSFSAFRSDPREIWHISFYLVLFEHSGPLFFKRSGEIFEKILDQKEPFSAFWSALFYKFAKNFQHFRSALLLFSAFSVRSMPFFQHFGPLFFLKRTEVLSRSNFRHFGPLFFPF